MPAVTQFGAPVFQGFSTTRCYSKCRLTAGEGYTSRGIQVEGNGNWIIRITEITL